MKWSIFQLLTAFFIGLFMWFLEYINGNRTIQTAPGEWTAVNSPYVTFLIVASVIACFYIIFLFEAKKEASFFENPIWCVVQNKSTEF